MRKLSIDRRQTELNREVFSGRKEEETVIYRRVKEAEGQGRLYLGLMNVVKYGSKVFNSSKGSTRIICF